MNHHRGLEGLLVLALVLISTAAICGLLTVTLTQFSHP